MKIAIVGATGLVGSVMRQVLEEMQLPVTEFIPVASERSVGTEVIWKGNLYKIVSIEEAIAARPDVAVFSAGGSTAQAYAPRFAEVGTYVVDNSSAFRMDADKPLIVPEVNIHTLRPSDRIIANPNCSTIQMVVALRPLHQRYRIERLVISTYQSISGTGQKALDQYEAELQGRTPDRMAYPHAIFQNCIPQCDVFLDNGYTKEEMKMVNETKKILGDDSLRISATTARVPVLVGHSESLNVQFAEDFELDEVRHLLGRTPGVIVADDPTTNTYPMPLDAVGKNEVFVGRLRRDFSQANTLNMWVVADNLRKGAATNALQIVSYLVEKGCVK